MANSNYGIDYGYNDLLPEHIRDGMQRYIEDGIPPGGFLQAVLSNDLMEAMGRADETNRGKLFDICSWLYNKAPGDCWKSPEHMQRWCDAGGLNGYQKVQVQ